MTKDKIFNWRFCLCCGIFIWFVVNLLQGIFTEIQEDEAYYVLFGEHLAWGYFDHPPMVGLMTFLSSIFFSGTLGVRFFTIIASCLSLLVMWKIANLDGFVVPPRKSEIRRYEVSQCAKRLSEVKDPEPVEGPTSKHVFLFFVLAFSIVMFNIYGFVTTPDASLILFSALFLLIYQHYLVDKSWKNALLMGVMMALMIYSKYHAFLFLGLIVLSNLKLLKDGKFYVACLLALALLTPHLLWQIHADFPSFKYHLMQRNESFRWSYFWEYLPNQLLVFNPFTFGAVAYVLIKREKTSLPYIDWLRRMQSISSHRTCSLGNDMHSKLVFERGLRFVLIGFFFFFWLMALRGHVEPHWTVVCVLPVVVLVYRKALVDNGLKKYIKFVILPSLLLIVAFRIILLTPIVSKYGFNGKEAYYKALEKVAADHPVVFRGSFQQPALYHYFTRKESATLRCYYDRKTQFDLWQFDKDWIGDSVFICVPMQGLSKDYCINGVEFNGYLAEHFQSANRLVSDFKITNRKEGGKLVFHHGDTLQMDFSIYNPYEKPIDFHHDKLDIGIKVDYILTNDFSYSFYDDITVIPPKTMYKGHLYAIVGDNVHVGKNRVALGLSDRIATFVTDGNYVDVEIKK